MSLRKKYQLVSTCYDKKGKILSRKPNEYNRSHPLMLYFSQKAGESEHKIYKHSELAAVLAAGNKRITKIFVERYNLDGTAANAKPCKTCQTMLKAFGVNCVEYTTDKGVNGYDNE